MTFCLLLLKMSRLFLLSPCHACDKNYHKIFHHAHNALLWMIAAIFVLTACTPVPVNGGLTTAQIEVLLPPHVPKNQKGVWATDIAGVFDELSIVKNAENICTAVAVIDQESNFAADPAVPNLGKSALSALDDKLEQKLGKTGATYFQKILAEKPTKDNNFLKRLKSVKTEQQLDLLFAEMVDYFGAEYKVGLLNNAAKLFNQGIDEKINPITTLGSMQVHIDYARLHRRQSGSDRALRADLYSRYGGLYYGIHRLLTYQAEYDKPIYRFADYNSGIYSSRNARVQFWINALNGFDGSGKNRAKNAGNNASTNKSEFANATPEPLTLDGDLLLWDGASAKSTTSNSERALLILAANNPALSGLTPTQIRGDLLQEKKAEFAQTPTFMRLKQAYADKTRQPLDKVDTAMMPQVVISGPKLSRDYDTNWYASAVNKRYVACVGRAKKAGVYRR